MKMFLTAIIFLTFSFQNPASTYAQNDTDAEKLLLKGIGGKEKWDSTNYILFAATGNNPERFPSNRRFLLNTKSGQVRFEGKSDNGGNIIALFNMKTGKLSKIFVNGQVEKQENDDIKDLLAVIKAQFNKDITFLFLPTVIVKPDTKTGKPSSRIINAEKLFSISFQSKAGLSGEVLFNGETGRIRQFTGNEGQTYTVSDYKDIGGGLFLPTIFKNMEYNQKSVSFTTVAAFTEMEESKFQDL